MSLLALHEYLDAARNDGCGSDEDLVERHAELAALAEKAARYDRLMSLTIEVSGKSQAVLDAVSLSERDDAAVERNAVRDALGDQLNAYAQDEVSKL